MSLPIWEIKDGSQRAPPLSVNLGRMMPVSEQFSRPAPLMPAVGTQCVGPLCAEFGPAGWEGHPRF